MYTVSSVHDPVQRTMWLPLLWPYKCSYASCPTSMHNTSLHWMWRFAIWASQVASWALAYYEATRKNLSVPGFPTDPLEMGPSAFFFEFFCTRHQCERAHVVPTSSYVMEDQKVGRSASVIVVFRFLFHQTFSTC